MLEKIKGKKKQRTTNNRLDELSYNGDGAPLKVLKGSVGDKSSLTRSIHVVSESQH